MSQFANFSELLETSVPRFADRDAFGWVGGASYTFRRVGELATQMRALLAELGVAPGDRVALWSENAPLWPVVYLGVTTFPAVIVPVLPDFPARDVDNIVNHAEAKVLFVSARLKTRLTDNEIGRALLNRMTVIDMETLEARLGTLAARAAGAAAPDDLAAIIYTSGTTGHSKGVMLTHRNLLTNLQMANDIADVKPHERYLSVLPLSHTYECTLGFLLALMTGASCWYFDRAPAPSVLMDGLRKVQPHIMLVVPLLIEKVVRNKVLAEINGKPALRLLSRMPVVGNLIMRAAGKKLMHAFGGNLRFFGVGGAPLAADVERELRRMKFPYCIGYGLTETAPLLAGSIPKYTKYRSTGPAAPGVELRLQDGEIQARGPNIMPGYYRNPELTAAVFTADGWFKTGDLGEIHPDGYVYVKGRSKSMILGANGENIYPEAIEAVINGHRGVAESLVLQRGQSLVARVRVDYEALAAALGKARDAAGRAVDATRDAAGRAVDATRDAAGRAVDATRDAVNAANDAARGAVSRAADATREAVNTANEAARDAVTRASDAARDAAAATREAAGVKAEEISQFLEELRRQVNEHLGVFSRLGAIEEEFEPFVKTPTMKIKRYLYEERK